MTWQLENDNVNEALKSLKLGTHHGISRRDFSQGLASVVGQFPSVYSYFASKFQKTKNVVPANSLSN